MSLHLQIHFELMAEKKAGKGNEGDSRTEGIQGELEILPWTNSTLCIVDRADQRKERVSENRLSSKNLQIVTEKEVVIEEIQFLLASSDCTKDKPRNIFGLENNLLEVFFS